MWSRRTVPPNRGTYALLLELQQETEIEVGHLARILFPAGHYIYVGSALGPGGLAARLARHLRHKKRYFWHIDYFLQQARVVDIHTERSGTRLECAWARIVRDMPGTRVVAFGFGASDCNCPSHLFFLGSDSRSHWNALCAPPGTPHGLSEP
jgi:Uri superfamily endonuclease